ncbi:cupin domain-containing protein [Actinomadura gamaensis]|uniref:Cupin domain-containing protein n=1 Tax=Actinomadura gamaensis TaxID=1763541 RepID=A0ABV9UA44_9ACTN
MTFVPEHKPVVVRAGESEVFGRPPSSGRLIVDADTTGGALSSQRIILQDGADGATPHHHNTASEFFHILGGGVQILCGDEILTAEEGDTVVVPPRTAHAFGALPGRDADLLIIITPGVRRFEYFRLLDRLGRGEDVLQELIDSQDLYDNHFLDSPAWKTARA